jgi:hypothetical protein
MALSTLIAAPLEMRGKKVMLVEDPPIDMLPDGERPLRHFKIKTAASIVRRQHTNMLLRARYAWRGYTEVALPTDPKANRITLTALEDGTVIGTITIGLDGEEGMASDAVFLDVIDPMRRAGRKVCEFTKLAIDPMAGTKRVLAALFHVAYIVAHRMRGYEILVMEVNPRHVKYYERMLGAKVLGESRLNKTVNAPAVLLSIEFDYIRDQIGEMAGQPERAATERSLYPFAFSLREEAGIIAKLEHTSHKQTSVSLAPGA